ncbi:MAG TPA: ankyrin repeat domain-containing protein [Verrucomicrobiae bacterium]|nr:ankyrin repeat domain-containing protein [Verrucomicrobiae bacterium]
MATVSRDLPDKPHLDVPKREARALLKDWRAQKPEALERIGNRHPRFRDADHAKVAQGKFLLNDAQLVIAREYGFKTWAELKERIDGNTVAGLLQEAIHKDDREAAVRLLRAHPNMLHVPLWSGNWGPPMSHAANLGRLEIIQAIAALGARDFQHAFDRALLQGKLETARWLHANGAKLAPGLAMGVCETLNPDGLGFLVELGAPLTDSNGDRMAPLALVLETYGRNPKGKHAVLEIFAKQGYAMPDTPIMAFHRGDVTRLREFLQRDPELIRRSFSIPEIYPRDLGCGKNGQAGMHWTPIDGTTLLHLAIDFDEKEVFEMLLAEGADVNARANVDVEGFGGHSPIFNAVVSHGKNQGAMARRLLDHGASTTARASLRKFLDWRDNPQWHVARDVTPAEWAQTFPDKGWVNEESLRLLRESLYRVEPGTAAEGFVEGGAEVA